MSQDAVSQSRSPSGPNGAREERIRTPITKWRGLQPLEGEEPVGLAAGGWKQDGKPNVIGEP
jgi:hypothetical protein